MSESNGTVEAGSADDVVTGANRVPSPKPAKKPKVEVVKGSAMAYYDAMRKTVAKKKAITLSADTDEAKVTFTVKSFPTLTQSAIESAASGGADTTFKLKGGVGGKDATAKASYEGEHGAKMAVEFFGIDTTEKE